MKKNKLMILLIILAALIAVYLGLSTYNKKADERKAAEEEAGQIKLVDADELDSLSYTDGSRTMNLTCDDGTWYYDEDQEIPLDQAAVEEMVSAVTDLTAVRELEEPDELSDYGLTDSLYTIKYTGGSADGVNTILIGNTTNENYYVTVGDTGKVYTIDSTLVGVLYFDLADIVKYDDVPGIGSGNLKKVEVTENGNVTMYEDESDIGELAGGFGTLSLTDCADYHVTDETIGNYGLSESERITAVATYEDSSTGEEETFTVYIGKAAEDGTNRYVMVDGSRMVYLVTAEIVNNMITVD